MVNNSVTGVHHSTSFYSVLNLSSISVTPFLSGVGIVCPLMK